MTKSYNSRIKYIDSLKGIACMFIFIGHYYYGLFASASKAINVYPWIVKEHSFFSLLYNGTFCVALFCFISGYLSKECKSIKDIVFNSVKRYIRLATPMMALGLLIYAVRNTFTFDSGDTISEMLGSTWVTSVGRGRNSLLAVIFNSFFGVLIFGKAGFSSQLWMLRPLLIGQVSFFIFSYSDYVKNKFVRNIMRIAVLLFCLGWEYPCLATFLGGLFHKYQKNFESLQLPDMLFAIGGGCALLLGHYRVYSLVPNVVVGTINIAVAPKVQVLLVLFVMCAIFKIKIVQKLLSAEILQKLGSLSLPIYLLHVLFIGSLSCWIIEKTYVRLGYPSAYFLAEIITVVSVITVSKVWNSTVDVWCNKLVNSICTVIGRMVYGKNALGDR